MKQPRIAQKDLHVVTKYRLWSATGLLLAVSTVILAACSAPDNLPPPSCPKATILEETSTLTRFREGPGRDPIDVNFTGTVTHLNGSCIYDVDEDTGAGILNMDVQVEVRVDRGPANRDRKVQFQYFVSILDINGKVIAKEIFPLAIEFHGTKMTSRETDDPVIMAIPVTGSQDSRDFSIFVGFQLSADEIRYNRIKTHRGN